MPTCYGTLVHTPAVAGVENDAHLLWHTCTCLAVAGVGGKAMPTFFGIYLYEYVPPRRLWEGGEAAVAGELHAVKNDAHLLSHTFYIPSSCRDLNAGVWGNAHLL
jgi:hypothetical protein